MKKFKTIWLSVWLLLSITLVSAQHNQPLNPPFKLVFEKVFIHTDRSLYIAGDTLWYKAYVTNAQTGKLSLTSGNLYVELIAPADTLVSRQIILLNKGIGNGDISLPDSLTSGTYRLRAYTNWMRNFGDNFIFEQTLIISGITSKQIKPVASINTAPSQPFTVRFYPEGGSLIKGVASIVAVKAETDDKALDFSKIKGSIYTATGDTITHFVCDSAGSALFTLLPLDLQPYRASIIYGKKVMNVNLPPAINHGITLRVNKLNTAWQVAISCNNETLKAMLNQTITLTGRHAGKVCFSQQLRLASAQFRVTVPINVFPGGITCISLYDNQMRPQAERLVYTEPDKKQAPQLSLAIPQTGYQPKEKVTLNIKVTEAFGKPVKANLSVAAADAEASSEASIAAYMLLQSEVKGNIIKPQQYFDTTNVNRHKQLDLLLLTQGWRDFLWRRMADTTIKISYAPEKGFTLKGRLRQKFANKPLVNKQVVASLLQGPGNTHMYLTTTDSTGAYRFDTLHVKGKHDVQLSALNGKQQGIGWLLVDSIKPNILPIKPSPVKNTVDAVNQYTEITHMSSLAQQRLAMRKGAAIKLQQVTVKKRRVTSPNYVADTYKPDQVFNISPKDHPLKTVEWFLMQNLKGARSANGDNITGIMVPGLIGKLPLAPTMQLISPILIVDGRELRYEENMAEMERKTIYNLPIESVKKMTFRHLYGTLLKAEPSDFSAVYVGDIYVLELTLKPGALNSPNVTKTSMEIDGYYQAREFYKPVYTQPNSVPDLRTTLHWDPLITTNAQGNAAVSYYNADSKTKVNVIVQGITDEGVPLYTRGSYVVK